jgi:hypothetical protein
MLNWEEVELNPKELLVKPLDDYYANRPGDSKFNATIIDNQDYEVGIVIHGGIEVPETWLGKVIYYTRHGQLMSIPKFGKFLKIHKDLTHLVRLDQDINNYKEKE